MNYPRHTVCLSSMAKPANQGTILYEVENLGRKLILVQWDGKSSTYAFPEDLEITSTRKSHNHFAK